MSVRIHAAKIGIACLAGVLATHLVELRAPHPIPATANCPAPAAVAPLTPLHPLKKPRLHAAAEFHPAFGGTLPENPALRMDRWTRLRGVAPAGGVRNLFDFVRPPEPRPSATSSVAVSNPAAGIPPDSVTGARSIPSDDPGLPTFYGFGGLSRPHGRAFFLQDGKVHVRAEGESIEGGYRVLAISRNQVVLEDPAARRRTVPLVPAPPER